MENKIFEKITKKYALNNSYFKNRRAQDPANPFEVLEYVKQHQELPYREELDDNWFYDCFIEYQKKAGVVNSQFFTPPQTAKQIAEIAKKWLPGKTNIKILDACCGFGQITKELYTSIIVSENSNNIIKSMHAFDIDKKLTDTCKYFCPQIEILNLDFSKDLTNQLFDMIVANPPYQVKELTGFFQYIKNSLNGEGLAILLIPIGFLDKTRPKRLVQILDGFRVLERVPMQENFARTNVRAEVVILQDHDLPF